MNLPHKLAKIIGGKPDNHRWSFVDSPLPEAFVAVRDDDKVVICWRGENYTRQRATLRIALHNWLIRIGNRRLEAKDVNAIP